jgi:uncharacterized protein (DUF362 family)
MSGPNSPRPFGRRDFLRFGTGLVATASAAFQPGCSLRPRECRQAPPNLFVADGKPLLVVVEGEDRGAMLRAGLEVLGGLAPLARLGHKAYLRGNYVAAQPYPVTTDPELIVAVANELTRAGVSEPSLFDTHGTHLAAGFKPDHNMRQLGVVDKLEASGVPVVARDFADPDEFVFVRNPDWSIDKPVAVHRLLHDVPIVVSLPCVKRHNSARFTCALKMHFGSVAMADRMLVHTQDDDGTTGLMHNRLVHFADAVRPQLNVVDARALLARSGPALGRGAEVVKGVNKLILSGDMVAVDAYCARLLAQHDETFKVDMIAPQLAQATAIGLGRADLDTVKVVEMRA